MSAKDKVKGRKLSLLEIAAEFFEYEPRLQAARHRGKLDEQ